MKRIIVLIMIVTLSVAALAEADNASLTLSVTANQGVVTGFVRNGRDQPITVNAAQVYGWWEFTTVLYFDQAWHEAPLTQQNRATHGTTPRHDITLAPGQVIMGPQSPCRALLPSDPPKECTFRLPLSDYQLPTDVSRVSALRIVTMGLWSDILQVRNPEAELRPAR